MDNKLYYVWEKGEQFQLGTHFSSKEFECKCDLKGCKKQHISKDLIVKLDRTRTKLKTPLVITSGYRCEEHNKAIGGAKHSQHPKGNAADVRARHMNKLYNLLELEFKAIGDARDSFIHIDVRNNKKRRWTY